MQTTMKKKLKIIQGVFFKKIMDNQNKTIQHRQIKGVFFNKHTFHIFDKDVIFHYFRRIIILKKYCKKR